MKGLLARLRSSLASFRQKMVAKWVSVGGMSGLMRMTWEATTEFVGDVYDGASYATEKAIDAAWNNPATRTVRNVGRWMTGDNRPAIGLHQARKPEAGKEAGVAPKPVAKVDPDYEKKRAGEPKAISRYANATTANERQMALLDMTEQTREWVQGLLHDPKAMAALRAASIQQIAAHVRGVTPMADVPRMVTEGRKGMTTDVSRIVSEAKSLYREERRQAKADKKAGIDPMVDPHGPGTVNRVIANMNETRTPREIVRANALEAREESRRRKALESVPGMRRPMAA